MRNARLGPLAAAVVILGLVPRGAAAQDAPLRQGTVEFFYGGYSIADPLFDTIYQPGGAIQGLGFTAALMPHVDFAFDLKVMVKNGLLSHSQEKTTFVLVPVSLGIRGSFTAGIFKPFAGAGFDYYAFVETNPIGTVVKKAAGWHLEGGIYFQFGKRFPVLPFIRIKQAFVNAAAGNGTVRLGGFEWGGGLAIAF